MNYAAEPTSAVPLGDCRLTPLLPESDTAKFEWTFSVTEQADGGALIAVEYAADLYTHETASMIAAELSRAVKALTTNLDKSIDQLVLLPEPDVKLLREWGSRPASASAESLAHDGLERSASSCPDEAAVIDGDDAWSYRELDEAADRVAGELESLGVGASGLVAICLARSACFVIAVHGAWKAGAAYLPLGIDEAPRRLEAILRESGVTAMVVDRSTPNELHAAAGRAGCRLLDLDCCMSREDPHERRASPRRRTGMERRPDDLAYVMYTSGTTGRPKGVMIEHRAVRNHAEAAIAEFGLGPGDRVAQLSTPAFDIFVEEVFPTFRAGATLVILDDETRRDPRRLALSTRDNRITMLDLPTASFHVLAEDDQAVEGLSDSLRLVVVGGERLDASLARRFLDSRPAIALVNTYGPTEATVIATAHRLQPTWDGRDVPIGRPIAGVEVLVLDRAGLPASIGAAGELHIGGHGLMRGYLGQPEATEAALVPHPDRPNEKLYRTGDLAAWGADGLLRFLGRADSQLKIRGYRVEPGEVEAALVEDPSVGRAAVVAVGERDVRRLVAFITPGDDGPVDAEQVRLRLAGRLPAYMQPAEVHVMVAFPLGGGKTDLRALAAIAYRPKAEPGPQMVAELSSPTEKQIARLWGEVLGREPGGPDDDFFDSGGHSLLAVRLVRRIEDEFGTTLPVAELFRSPTIRGLSGLVPATSPQPVPAPSAPRASVLRRAVATFILPGLPGIGAQYYELADCLPTDGEVLALSLPGYEGDEPATNIAQMAEHWRDAVERMVADRSVRFIAHSYAGNILHEMLRSGSRRYRVDSIFLLDAMPHERMALLDGDLLASWTAAFGLDLIPDARAVVEAALRGPHGSPALRLDLEATLVVAEQSRSWLDPTAWDRHFSAVNLVETAGDHLSIVRRPDCSRWVEQVFPFHPGGRP